MVESVQNLQKTIDDFAVFVEEHKNMPYRAQTVSYRILRRYLEYCKNVARLFELKASGKEHAAKAAYDKFRVEFGKYELEMEHCYDQQMCFGSSLSRVFAVISDKATDTEEPFIFQQ